MIYGVSGRELWGGGLTLKQSRWLVVCLHLEAGLPDALFLLASFPPLFPVGQHNFVFPNL